MNKKARKYTLESKLAFFILLRTTDGITTGNTQYLHVEKNKRPVLIPRISHVGPDYNTWNCDHFALANGIDLMAAYCANFPSPGYYDHVIRTKKLYKTNYSIAFCDEFQSTSQPIPLMNPPEQFLAFILCVTSWILLDTQLSTLQAINL
jgi:hypothetical protein